MKQVALLSFVALFVGCGGTGNPPTVPVSGTVMMNGKPVEGANVTFLPDSQENKPAVGRTDAEGKFVLTSFESGDGAMVGSYKIMVSKYNTPDGVPEQAADAPVVTEDMTEEEAEAVREAAYAAGAGDMEKAMKGRPAVAKNLLPEKYATVATSGLSATVTDGENVVPIELKK